MSKKSRKRNKKILGLLAAGLGAAALMKRRKAKALNAITDYGDTGPLSGKAGFEGDVPSVPKKTYLQKGKELGEAIPHLMAPENEFFLAKGGRVGVGKAKRGFGRALRKK